MKKALIATAVAAACAAPLVAFAQAAAAAPAPEYTFSGNAGLFSDYRFRGFSQTDYNPAFQGGFDVGRRVAVSQQMLATERAEALQLQSRIEQVFEVFVMLKLVPRDATVQPFRRAANALEIGTQFDRLVTVEVAVARDLDAGEAEAGPLHLDPCRCHPVGEHVEEGDVHSRCLGVDGSSFAS